MRRAGQAARALVAVVTVGAMSILVAGCDDSGGAGGSGRTAAAKQEPAAPAPAPPVEGACYAMAYDAAIAPTSEAPAVDCAQEHTTETAKVGALDATLDGHLVAVDSAHVQRQVATACPAAVAEFLGGSQDAVRLSMVRPVWFTPTVEQSDAGANWFRCDAVTLAGTSKLAPLTGSLKGALKGKTPDAYAMCGTSAPDAQDFERVPCSAKHAWRAIAVVPFDAGDYPGEAKVRSAGRGRCEDAAADRASDPLTFEWGYEWPTAQQWKAGQTFGRCWIPD